MLLPTKHIKPQESLLAIGGLVLSGLEAPKSIDQLWDEMTANEERSIHRHNFDELVLAVDFLYAIGAVKLTGTGEIARATD